LKATTSSRCDIFFSSIDPPSTQLKLIFSFRESIVADYPTESARILVLSKDRSALSLLWIIGDANGWQLETADNGWEALDRVQSGAGLNAIVLDLARDHVDGWHTLRWLRRVRPDLPIVTLSSADEAGKKVEAVRLGAQECVVRPLAEEQVEKAIRRSLNGLSANRDLETSFNEAEAFEHVADDVFFIAAGPSMRKLRAQADLLAQVSAPVLITGETGSGKELAARLIHKLSVRSAFPFLKLNCVALPGEALESELFGQEPTLAANARTQPSKVELCHRGTLFLEQITEMPMNAQAKLLHAFQEGHFITGEGQNKAGVGIRVVAGTSLSVEQAIAERKLREDLYYQLSAFTIHVPPLRQRREEIPLLLRHFMNRLSRWYDLPMPSLSQAVVEACQRYDWPGNMRELEEFVKFQFVDAGQGLLSGLDSPNNDVASLNSHPPAMAQETHVDAADFPDLEQRKSGLKSLLQSVRGEAERNAITIALDQTRWNRKAAARLLKVSYRTLLYKIQQYHMTPPVSPFVMSTGAKHGHAR
jgi:two-component system response regulator AtoC